MSYRARRQSKWVLTDSAASASAGPPENRPPHRLTPAGPEFCCESAGMGWAADGLAGWLENWLMAPSWLICPHRYLNDQSGKAPWRIAGNNTPRLRRKAQERERAGGHQPTGRKKGLPWGSPAMP